MDEAKLQADHVAVRETYERDGEFYRWKIFLANGNVLTGEIRFDPTQGEEELKALCRVEAEAMLQNFLGLDSTTLVQSLDINRSNQIAQYEADLLTTDARLENLRNGITTGIYLDAEKLSVAEQIQQLVSFRTVLVRKLNRMKL
jgi:hypothetical protein